MCQNATKTVASLLLAIEPTLKSLLTFTGLLNTPAGQAAINAYNAALAAVENWQSGTAAQTVLEVIQAFLAAFNAVSVLLPPGVGALVNIIAAGIQAVIGVVTANSPAPASSTSDSPDETQAAWAAHVVEQTSAKIKVLVPSFKRSFFHSAAWNYKQTWNSEVANGGFDTSLLV